MNLDWYDYGARFYDPALGRFTTQDPLADERYWVSPYNYVQNNPINRIDPTGAIDDWVKNKETDQYEWMDKATSEETTPSGYRYVGNSGNDILKDLNLPTDYSAQEVKRKSFGLDGDNKSGAPVGSDAEATGTLRARAVLGLDENSKSENNASGLVFKGVAIEASLSQNSQSGSADLTMRFEGHLSVQYGEKSSWSFLKSPTSETLSSSSNMTQAGVFFSSKEISSSKIFKTATINAGVTNPALFVQPKGIKMSWNLRQNPVLVSE